MASLIGFGGGKAAAPAPGGGDADLIKDVDTPTFMTDVVDASMSTPVIVDFWATWCGPCRQITPVLENAVRAARGKVRLAKVDIDRNQEIAAQMRVQSIPAVYAFFQGRPVDAFVGAQPESQIKAFVERLTKLGGDAPGDPIADALAQAKATFDEGEYSAAASIYKQIIEADPGNPDAIAGLGRCFLARNKTKDARALIDGLDEETAKTPAIVSLVAALELAAEGVGDVKALQKKLDADADDHAARYDLANAVFALGDRERAIDELIAIVRRDREWREDEARKRLVKMFEAIGPTDPLTIAGRRKLSSAMFK
ncbi:MAG: thioredoxin [Pseudomonadota bacterium]